MDSLSGASPAQTRMLENSLGMNVKQILEQEQGILSSEHRISIQLLCIRFLGSLPLLLCQNPLVYLSFFFAVSYLTQPQLNQFQFLTLQSACPPCDRSERTSVPLFETPYRWNTRANISHRDCRKERKRNISTGGHNTTKKARHQVSQSWYIRSNKIFAG